MPPPPAVLVLPTPWPVLAAAFVSPAVCGLKKGLTLPETKEKCKYLIFIRLLGVCQVTIVDVNLPAHMFLFT